MRQTIFYIILCTVCLSFSSCKKDGKKSYEEYADSGLTVRTENMKENLKNLHEKGVLIGQMYGTICGAGWEGDTLRSDINSVCGEFTACTGYELSDTRSGEDYNGMPLLVIRKDILQMTRRGGLVLLKWLLPEPAGEDDLEEMAASMAQFLNSLEDGYGKKSPVVLFPMPLDEEEWYAILSVEESKRLYSKMAEMIREEAKNVVLGFSISSSMIEKAPLLLPEECSLLEMTVPQATEGELGEQRWKALTGKLQKLSSIAKEKNLALGITLGDYCEKDSAYWSKGVLPLITSSPLAYALFRENSGIGGAVLAACPYPGSPDIADFMTLYNDKRTLFSHDLNGLYLKANREK